MDSSDPRWSDTIVCRCSPQFGYSRSGNEPTPPRSPLCRLTRKRPALNTRYSHVLHTPVEIPVEKTALLSGIGSTSTHVLADLCP